MVDFGMFRNGDVCGYPLDRCPHHRLAPMSHGIQEVVGLLGDVGILADDLLRTDSMIDILIIYAINTGVYSVCERCSPMLTFFYRYANRVRQGIESFVAKSSIVFHKYFERHLSNLGEHPILISRRRILTSLVPGCRSPEKPHLCWI